VTPEALRLWQCRRAPESRWRRAAIATIGNVIKAHPELLSDEGALLQAVDAAYPFGSREMLPYKMWLLERKIFREACAAATAGPEEHEAVQVAGDMVEWGRVDDARRLLAGQAPNRHGRACPACKARVGQPCTGFGTGLKLLVPHLARVCVYRDHGPLFQGDRK